MINKLFFLNSKETGALLILFSVILTSCWFWEIIKVDAAIALGALVLSRRIYLRGYSTNPEKERCSN